MEVDFSGNYTNSENCHENDIGTITSEGEQEEKESFAGKKYMQTTIDVELNGKELVHTIGITEGKALVAVWGKETKEWIGKKFKCHVVRYVSQGQTKQKIEIEPIEVKV